jgi:hypothetical protein
MTAVTDAQRLAARHGLDHIIFELPNIGRS